MKLLYITNGINAAGGLERVLSIKASYLADHYGYEVSILSLNDNHLNPFYKFSDKINMFSITVKGNPLKYFVHYTKGIRKVVNQIQPDIISVCDDGIKGFFIPKILITDIPIIYERHASVKLNFNRENKSFYKILKSKLESFLIRKLATNFEKFIVLTEGNLQEWTGHNLKVIPNPLSFYPKEQATLKNKCVIAVGSHSYNKGYDLLLMAWQKVICVHKDWVLNIYGKKDKKSTFVKQAKDLMLKKNVNFFQPVNNIQNKYIDASIMVLPSRSEGFGMVLIEAMACGLPAVSFNCPHGPADILTNGEDGFLVENGNTEKLASHILKLIEDVNLRMEMGTKAKENVERYLPEIIVKQWDELFKSLVS